MGKLHKRIYIDAFCLSRCGNRCGGLKIFQFNTIFNPDKKNDPFTYYVGTNFVEVNTNKVLTYHSKLDLHQVLTD